MNNGTQKPVACMARPIRNHGGKDDHVRTIQEWHYKTLRMPFHKTGPGKNSSVVISKEAALDWMHQAWKRGKSQPQKEAQKKTAPL